MPATPPQPRRTVPIIVLDRIVSIARAVRRALPGRGRGSWATWVALVAALGVLVATAVSVIGVLRTPEAPAPLTLNTPPPVDEVGTPPVGTSRGQAQPAATAPTTSAPPPAATTTAAAPTVGSSSGVPSPTAPTIAPTPAALRADFAVAERALFSYRAAVTISNAGQVPVPLWKLVITLPRESLSVESVDGAQASRDGAVWTFVPDGSTGQVPGSGSVQVTFRVNGTAVGSAPTGCSIDGAACTGLDD
ncbi:cellulose binding domain-containing protein [Micromonospora sp. GCM10011542]|uniref:cellulose binding domain-containing protein n=1 Tax=Micromonospora sp. GCM10011542 TaxID=3317337 RepID=UPI003610F856